MVDDKKIKAAANKHIETEYARYNSGKVEDEMICLRGKEIWEGDMLSNVTNDSPDGLVVFKYGAFSLLAKNGRDFCVALTYLLSEKDSLNRFKVVGNKFDKEK